MKIVFNLEFVDVVENPISKISKKRNQLKEIRWDKEKLYMDRKKHSHAKHEDLSQQPTYK